MLAQTGGDVGDMVLDGDRGQAGCFSRAARGVVGMQVADRPSRRYALQRNKIGDGGVEAPARGRGNKIAQMLAHDHAAGCSEGDGGLEMSAEGQRGIARAGSGHQRGGMAARTTQDLRAATDDLHDRIVERAHDGPVVDEEQVRDPAESLDRLGLVDHDGVLGQIAAGGDHGEAEVGHQEMMQRRVGQQRAEPAIAGRHGRRNAIFLDAFEQHDRPLGRSECHLGRCVDTTGQAGGREVGKHHRERLFGALLAKPQPADRFLVVCCSHQVEAADSLDGSDPSIANGLDGSSERLSIPNRRCAAFCPQQQPRAAVRAGIRFGMESAIAGIPVFRTTGGAHREPAYRCARPVVGMLDDASGPHWVQLMNGYDGGGSTDHPRGRRDRWRDRAESRCCAWR